MRAERIIFERKIKEYKDKAQQALDTVNGTVDLFNSYGSPFTVYDKNTFSQKCKDGFIDNAVESILNKAKSGGVREDKLYRIEHRCRLIAKILTDPAKMAKQAMNDYGRVFVFDSERLCFMMDRDKLDGAAMRHADDL